MTKNKIFQNDCGQALIEALATISVLGFFSTCLLLGALYFFMRVELEQQTYDFLLCYHSTGSQVNCESKFQKTAQTTLPVRSTVKVVVKESTETFEATTSINMFGKWSLEWKTAISKKLRNQKTGLSRLWG